MSAESDRGPGHAPGNARIATNAVWTLLRYGVNWLALLAIPPLIIRDLGKESYATWTIVLQIAAYYSMIDIHIQTAAARFIARSAASGDRAELNDTIASVMLFLLALTALLIGPALWGTLSIDALFPAIPDALAGQARVSATIMLLGLAASLPFTAMLGTFLGLERSGNVTIATVMAKIVSVGLMVVAVKLGGGIVSLAGCFVAGIGVTVIYYIRSWRSLREVNRVDLRSARSDIVRSFGAYSGSSFLLAVCSVLLVGVAIPIITTYDFGGVARYALAAIYANLLLIPQSAILWVVLPRMSERSRSNDPDLMESLLLKLASLSSISLASITSGLVAIAPAFLGLWVGPAMAKEVLPLAIPLVLAQFIGLTMHPYRVAVAGTGEQLRTVPAILVEGTTTAVLSLVLVRSYGAWGVAVAGLAGALAGVIAHLTVSVRLIDSVNVSRRRYLRFGILLPAMATAPAVIASCVGFDAFSPYAASIVTAAVCCGFALGFLWRFSLGRADRRELQSIAHAAWTRLTNASVFLAKRPER